MAVTGAPRGGANNDVWFGEPWVVSATPDVTLLTGPAIDELGAGSGVGDVSEGVLDEPPEGLPVGDVGGGLLGEFGGVDCGGGDLVGGELGGGDEEGGGGGGEEVEECEEDEVGGGGGGGVVLLVGGFEVLVETGSLTRSENYCTIEKRNVQTFFEAALSEKTWFQKEKQQYCYSWA